MFNLSCIHITLNRPLSPHLTIHKPQFTSPFTTTGPRGFTCIVAIQFHFRDKTWSPSNTLFCKLAPTSGEHGKLILFSSYHLKDPSAFFWIGMHSGSKITHAGLEHLLSSVLAGVEGSSVKILEFRRLKGLNVMCSELWSRSGNADGVSSDLSCEELGSFYWVVLLPCEGLVPKLLSNVFIL